MNRNRILARGPALLALFALALGIAAIAARPTVLAAQVAADGSTISDTGADVNSPNRPPDIVDIPGIGRVDLAQPLSLGAIRGSLGATIGSIA
jgi:hypothetical protein